ncbi:MAG TPA: CoA pyrophosphatase [Rhodobacteraceae bacterium]|jgi:8-oxo-dGTP pyrophosphatase MutT (NUDIX family)|nr:CoA pyrophosphatase [Paracoccaceae bacterium]HBG99426.1 CoA pyrophosphatase [Paracoccaceae bacterium]
MAEAVFARLAAALARPGPASSDFDLNPGDPPAMPAPTRAAVLIAVEAAPAGPRLWLTRRAPRMRHHAGQIALPGGRLDPGDAGPGAAALREAEEEIGLPRTSVVILGQLPEHDTVTGFRVAPVVGRVTAPFAPIPEPGEVAEVFAVPWDHVADPANYRVEARHWRGSDRRYFTLPWGPYYIWGATARILRGLAARLDA